MRVTGAEPAVPSTFPAVGPSARTHREPGAASTDRPPSCQTRRRLLALWGVINRADIVWLGISSGVMGCLVGGMMLGIGMDLIVNGQPLGWLLMLPGAPISAIQGWLLGRRLAQQL